MELNYFDLAIGIIVLLLGLKGIINGFFKEMFGLIGIVGGIFIASRIGNVVGKEINDAVFHFSSDAAVNFTGFLLTLAVFWIIMIVLGMLFKKMSKLSGLGAADKILGFLFGSGKFFLIGSIIVYAVFNIKTIRENLAPAMENSILFPIMVDTGSYIMHLDPAEIAEDLNTTVDAAEKQIDAAAEKVAEATVEIVKTDVHKTIDEVKENLKSKASENGQQ